MAIGIGDIVGAKMAAQLKWAPADRLRAELEKLDAKKEHADLVSHLAELGLLDGARAAKLRRYIDLYERVRREALYCALVEKANLLSKDELNEWKQRLDDEGYQKSLGEHLLAAKKINPMQAGQLRQQQFVGIDKENDRLLAGYRKSRFEGVARPITKKPDARIETRTITIRELFRSAESQRLARAALMDTKDAGESTSGAGETTPGLRSPLRGSTAVPNRVGAYVVEGMLGKGGMGMVLLARHESGGDQVAVKVGLQTGDEVKARMRREILATSMLHHENIVQVLDAGDTEDGRPYLVMEYVKGRELRDLLRERKHLAPREALAIFLQLLAACGAAHRAGVVHRDLKPENVLIIEDGGKLAAKLMDFGLARILEVDPAHQDHIFKTQATDVVSGSPQYLSPEQVLGDNIDGRTDLYALGIVLFELLTGAAPWTAQTMNELLRAHVSRPPRKLADARPDVAFPPALEALVASLLEKTPAKRPETAEAVIGRVEKDVMPALTVAASIPPPPPPPPPPPSHTPPPRPRGITRMLEALRDDDVTPKQ
ncbi:MAG: serine/threonine-protein kinase [Planctomycetota bacterium]